MASLFLCPGCGHSVSSAAAAGDKIHCPGCGKSLGMMLTAEPSPARPAVPGDLVDGRLSDIVAPVISSSGALRPAVVQRHGSVRPWVPAVAVISAAALVAGAVSVAVWSTSSQSSPSSSDVAWDVSHRSDLQTLKTQAETKALGGDFHGAYDTYQAIVSLAEAHPITDPDTVELVRSAKSAEDQIYQKLIAEGSTAAPAHAAEAPARIDSPGAANSGVDAPQPENSYAQMPAPTAAVGGYNPVGPAAGLSPTKVAAAPGVVPSGAPAPVPQPAAPAAPAAQPMPQQSVAKGNASVPLAAILPGREADRKIGRSLDAGINFLISRFQNGQVVDGLGADDVRHQGLDALCVYALIHASEGSSDPRLSIHGQFMVQLIETLKSYPMQGRDVTKPMAPVVYARSLRAAALAVYNRREDQQVLRGDVAWLVHAQIGGAYTYDDRYSGNVSPGQSGSAAPVGPVLESKPSPAATRPPAADRVATATPSPTSPAPAAEPVAAVKPAPSAGPVATAMRITVLDDDPGDPGDPGDLPPSDPGVPSDPGTGPVDLPPPSVPSDPSIPSIPSGPVQQLPPVVITIPSPGGVVPTLPGQGSSPGTPTTPSGGSHGSTPTVPGNGSKPGGLTPLNPSLGRTMPGNLAPTVPSLPRLMPPTLVPTMPYLPRLMPPNLVPLEPYLPRLMPPPLARLMPPPLERIIPGLAPRGGGGGGGGGGVPSHAPGKGRGGGGGSPSRGPVTTYGGPSNRSVPGISSQLPSSLTHWPPLQNVYMPPAGGSGGYIPSTGLPPIYLNPNSGSSTPQPPSTPDPLLSDPPSMPPALPNNSSSPLPFPTTQPVPSALPNRSSSSTPAVPLSSVPSSVVPGARPLNIPSATPPASVPEPDTNSNLPGASNNGPSPTTMPASYPGQNPAPGPQANPQFGQQHPPTTQPGDATAAANDGSIDHPGMVYPKKFPRAQLPTTQPVTQPANQNPAPNAGNPPAGLNGGPNGGPAGQTPQASPSAPPPTAAANSAPNLVAVRPNHPQASPFAPQQQQQSNLPPAVDPNDPAAILKDPNLLRKLTQSLGNNQMPWDNSNSQYGLLGVWAGAEVGCEVPNAYWQAVKNHWETCEYQTGQWCYSAYDPAPSLAMTCAGVSSLLITHEWLDLPAAGTRVGRQPYSGHLAAGLKWLETDNNVTNVVTPDLHYLGYTVYGIERTALASGFKFFGTHDWYAELAEQLSIYQFPTGAWGSAADGTDSATINTAYMVLFLSRGRHPVLMNKLRFEPFWDNRPRDLANLAKYASQELERPFNWQVVSFERPWADWMDAPVLYIASHKAPVLTDEDYAKLKAYADAGGMIFTHCDSNSGPFNTWVDQLAKRLWPQYPLQSVDRDSPLYSSNYHLAGDKKLPTFKTVSNGSRILLVHCPTDSMSAQWQDGARSERDLFQMGLNLFVYAAGRSDFRNRLDSPFIPEPTTTATSLIRVTRLKYDGNWDPEPYAWTRFGRYLHWTVGTDVESQVLDLDALKDVKPSDRPVAVLTGNAAVTFTDSQAGAIRTFVKAGGTLLVDSCGGNADFTKSAQDLIAKALPETPLADVANTDPIVAGGTALLDNLTKPLGRPYNTEAGVKTRPVQVIHATGRVVFAPMDLTTGLLGARSWGIVGYSPEYSEKLVNNVIESVGSP